MRFSKWGDFDPKLGPNSRMIAHKNSPDIHEFLVKFYLRIGCCAFAHTFAKCICGLSLVIVTRLISLFSYHPNVVQDTTHIFKIPFPQIVVWVSKHGLTKNIVTREALIVQKW